MRRASVLAVIVAACGYVNRAPPEIDPNALPIIVAFSAGASVLPGDSARIEYEVENARSIEISVGERTVLSTFESEGGVLSGPLRHDSIITLTARNRDHVATASRMITVRWAPPVIESFGAPPRALINSTTNVSWSARNVDVLRILRDGNEIFRAADEKGEARVGVGDAERTTFVLEVSNPRGTVTSELSVEGVLPPQVLRFAIQPRVWFGGVQPATIFWEVRDTTELRINYTSYGDRGPIDDLLHGAVSESGSIPIEIDEHGFWGISALSEFGGTGVGQSVDAPIEEVEPNGSLDSSTFIGVGAIGALGFAGDVDFYTYSLDFGLSGLRFYLAGPDGTGCPFDATLSLSTHTRSSFVARDGCAPIELDAEELEALRLEDANVYIGVFSDIGALGHYSVLTEEL